MADFKITKGTAKDKAWKAVGKNPKTGRQMTIQGGQKGARVMPGTAKAKSFLARHGKPETPKQLVNDRIWKGKAKIGRTVRIPHELF